MYLVKYFRLYEQQKPGWREKMIELNKTTMITKEQLINLEVILMDELEVNAILREK